MSHRLRTLATAAAIALLAGLLRLIAGTGSVNYDTLYALVWGHQLAHGQTPEYGLAIAPTPHPLLELLGVVLAPLGARATVSITIALGFLALAAAAYAVLRLGAAVFGRAAGLLAAVLLLTRVPILSYGVRAYVDVPYLALVLLALLCEVRRPRAGWPVLVLLGVAGLLRPEAWAFSGLYWLWLARGRPPRERAGLAALALAAPALWLLSDLAVTGDPLWSLVNTRHTATALSRVTGAAHVPVYSPRRIGEILRPAGLAAAAVGGVLSLLWLRERVRVLAVAGVLAVLVFALFAAVGLPINTRYAFGAAAVLCVFCAAGICGWTLLPRGDRRRTVWAAAGGLLAAGLLATAPSQLSLAHRELSTLATQQSIGDDLGRLVKPAAITLRCGPVGVPNHRPVPLLALLLGSRPGAIADAQVRRIDSGVYVDPATARVRSLYTLDPHDPHPLTAAVPAGFTLRAENRSWRVWGAPGCTA